MKKILLASLSLLFAVNSHAELPPFRHDVLNIFPAAEIAAPGKSLAIDGDVSDWNPEAFVTMAADLDNKERYAMAVAAAYDAEGLLLAVRFTDDTPLVNRVDPIGQSDKGWAGDSFQIRFITDPRIGTGELRTDIQKDPEKNSRVVHMTLWQNSDKKLPAIHAAYGWDFNTQRLLTGEDSHFKFAPVEGGYVMEGRLPWALLRVTAPPAPGTDWVMTVQGNWSGGGVNDLGHSFYDLVCSAGFPYQTSAAWGRGHFVKPEEVAATLAAQQAAEAKLWAAPAAEKPAVSIPVRYTNPAQGYVSLAITAADGVTRPGGQIIRTLLTRAMRPAGEQTEHWDGLDDDGQPVPAGSYEIRALTQGGLKPRFVASVHNSGTPPWATEDGTGSMSGDHGYPVSAAADAAGNVYLLWTFNELGSGIQCMNAEGRKTWGGYLDWGVFDGGYTALAYDDAAGLVYVAMDGANTKPDQPNRGGIYAFNAKTGRRASVCGGKDKLLVTEWSKELAKEKPHGPLTREKMEAGAYGPEHLGANLVAMAVGGDRIYASLYLEDKIIAIDKATGRIAESYAVPKPAGLAFDANTKTLYAVSGDGIVKLDMAAKSPVPQAFLPGLDHPFGLALDKAGNLYVSVRGKQMQVLVYSPDGKQQSRIGKDGGRPWLGRYDAKGMLMPAGIAVDAAGRLWVMENDATPKRVSRWQTQTGKLEQEYFGNTAYSPMMAPDPEKPEEVYYGNTRFIVDYDKGTVRTDATIFRPGWNEPTLGGSGSGMSSFQLAMIGGKKFATDGAGGLYAVGRDEFRPLWYLGGRAKVLETFFAKDDLWGTSYRWQDANGDGLIQVTEVERITGHGYIRSQRSYGGDDLYPGGAMLRGGRLYRPTGLSAQGIPVYPKPDDAPKVECAALKGYHRIDTVPALRSDFKEFYTLASEKYDAKTRDGVGKQGLYKFVNGGDILWRYSRVAIDFATKSMPARSGDLFGALRVAGQAELPEKNGGEIVAVSSYWGYYSFVSGDGLFLGDVGQDMRRGPKPSQEQTYVENFSGYFFRHHKTGKLYLFGGDTDGRIWEITGWESIQRIAPAPVAVTEEEHRQVVQARQGAATTARVTTLAATAGAPAAEAATAARIDLSETEQAKLALGYDAERLHAVFQVPDRSPWRNTSSDWRYAFKGGDALDIQLGEGTEAKPVQPGDVRVVIAPAANEKGFVAFGMWPKVAGGGAAEPQLYKSPVREVPFERVALLAGVECHIEKTDKGYIAKISIPWKELGLKAPAKGATLRGDVGVLVSDDGGQRTVLRRFLFNQNTAITMDAPTEAEIEPQYWGLLKFE
jgi:sugar lactone lactonase YvrE